jgi:hypothetical protein
MAAAHCQLLRLRTVRAPRPGKSVQGGLRSRLPAARQTSAAGSSSPAWACPPVSSAPEPTVAQVQQESFKRAVRHIPVLTTVSVSVSSRVPPNCMEWRVKCRAPLLEVSGQRNLQAQATHVLIEGRNGNPRQKGRGCQMEPRLALRQDVAEVGLRGQHLLQAGADWQPADGVLPALRSMNTSYKW